MAGNVAELVYDIDSTSALGAARDLQRLEKATAGLADQEAKLNRVYRDSRGRFQTSADFASKNKREIESLARSYNPLMAANLAYAKEVERTSRAVQIGVITEGERAAQLANTKSALDRAAQASKNYAIGMNGVSNIQSSVGNQFAQLNDVVVTAWGGMNPALIGMQQGMQIVQGFAGQSMPQALGTLKGAFAQLLNPMTLLTVGGVALAATVIQFGASFLTASGQAESLDDVIGRIATSTDNLKKASTDAIAPLEELRKKYGENAEAVREWLRLDLMRQQAMALETAAPQIAELVSLANAYDGLGLTVEGRLNETRNLAQMFKWNAVEAGKFQVILRKLTEAKTLQEQAEAAEEVRNFIAQAGTATDALNSKFGAALQGIAPLVTAAWELATAMSAASAASAPTATMFDDRQQSIQENMAGIKDARAVALERTQSRWLDPDTGGGGGGGGGGSALAQAEKQFQSLRELMERETIFQFAEYEKRKLQLDNALAQKLLSEQLYQEMRMQLQTLYFGTEFEQNAINYQMDLEQLNLAFEQKLVSEEAYLIKKRQLQWKYGAELQQGQNNQWSVELDGMADAFGAMNQLAGGGYDKLLKAQQIFSAASALFSTLTGASKALELPFPMNMVAMAKVMAAGMGLVNAIKGGGKASAAGSGSAASTAQAATKTAPQQFVTIDVVGDSWAVGLVEGIVEQIQQQTKDGRIVFMGNR